MIKLPTVKLNGKTAFVINRHQVEDDVEVAEAICRDAEKWRWLMAHWDEPETHDLWLAPDKETAEQIINERI